MIPMDRIELNPRVCNGRWENDMNKDSFRSFEDLECWRACTDDRGKSYSLMVISYS